MVTLCGYGNAVGGCNFDLKIQNAGNAGAVFPCSESFAATVCEPRSLAAQGAELAAGHGDLLCELVNGGHLYLEAPP